MDWKKRVTGALLAGIMLLSMLPTAVAAETDSSGVLDTDTEVVTEQQPQTPADSDITLPETETPAVTESTEPAEPEAAGPETVEPETTEPETTEPETMEPETMEPTESVESAESVAAPAIDPVPLRTDHFAYMTGNTDGIFAPNQNLTWAQISVMLYNILADQSMGAYPYTYTDVKSGSWYYQAVSVLASRGILECHGGKLNPNQSISRADFVTVVVRLIGVDETATCQFTDVSPQSSYYAAVATAVQKGWISGFGDGTFRPNAFLSRAQAATILNLVLNRKIDQNVLASATDLRYFPDVSKKAWYYAAVMEATIAHDGVANEDGTETWNSYTHSYVITLKYSGTSTTQLIYEGLRPTVPKKDKSGKMITHWMAADGTVANPEKTPVYQAAVYTAWYAPSLITAHKQYVSGLDSKRFGPNQALTRAQAAMLLYGLLADQKKGTCVSTFTDVKSGAWYYNAVTVLASKGLLTGGGAFRPNAVMTRVEFVEMVTRLTTYTAGKVTFTDVPADHPYYDAIATASAKGWISGFEDNTFRPNASLTRAQAVIVFNKIMDRTGDKTTEQQMDSRYTFTDVAKSAWYYQAVMEAATTHSYQKTSSGSEKWSEYYHNTTGKVSWESSSSVVAASKITNSITSTYRGDFTHNYNMDYSDGLKEWYVNSKGYSSQTKYLVWVSRQNQKVYVFAGSKGKWKVSKTFICGTGKLSTPTPTGVTYITYREAGWNHGNYSCKPVVRFYPNTGYAFHSRLYYPNYNGLKDPSIGWPVSAGCVRMLDTDITYLYKNVPNKSTVVIY